MCSTPPTHAPTTTPTVVLSPKVVVVFFVRFARERSRRLRERERERFRHLKSAIIIPNNNKHFNTLTEKRVRWGDIADLTATRPGTLSNRRRRQDDTTTTTTTTLAAVAMVVKSGGDRKTQSTTSNASTDDARGGTQYRSERIAETATRDG